MNIQILEENFHLRRLAPFGLELSAKNENTSLAMIHPDRIHSLMLEHKILLFRNLETLSEKAFIHYGESLGELLAWDFGVLMEMRAHEKPENYLFTHGPVPFHWDGAFHKEPSWLFFHCVEAPAEHAGGETLFCNTELLWNNASEEEKNAWKTKKLRYKTKKIAHYGGEIEVPMVQKHPLTQKTFLRFAEPVPPEMLNPVELSIDTLSPEQLQAFVSRIKKACYDAAFCYTHRWKNNDLLLADNVSLLHGRHAFGEFSPRFLRRIQIL